MNWFLILIALFFSSICFIFLSILAILFSSWLKIYQDLEESNLSLVNLNLKGILKSLFFNYLLEFLIPLAIFIVLFYFLPFRGIKFGISFALLVFIFSALQTILLSLEGARIPFNFAVHTLFWKLLRYLVSFGMAGFILSL